MECWLCLLEYLLLPVREIVKVAIIVPAFNEGKILAQVLKNLKNNFKHKDLTIVVIDDGSADNTAKIAEEGADIVLRHFINRGLGASIKTGLEWAKLSSTDIVVTFDGDGQHNPKEIKKIIAPILKGNADVVIGTRFKNISGVPFDRLIINMLANFATFMFFGVLSSDTQSGFRAFSKKAISKINLTADRMEVSTEILVEAKRNNLILKEVPIDVIYTNYSREKGQKNTNAFPILFKFAVKLFR